VRCAALLTLLAAGPLFAQTLPTPGVAALADRADDKYITAGGKTPDDWRFVLGPVNRKDDVLNMKLLRLSPDGAIGFACNPNYQKRPNGEKMGFSTKTPLPGKPGQVVRFHLAIDDVSHDIDMVRQPDKPGSLASYEASGNSVAVILASMGAVAGTNRSAQIAFSSPDGEEIISMPIPDPREIAKVAGKLCDGWAKVAAGVSPLPPAKP
jgi:hypothetical protein